MQILTTLEQLSSIQPIKCAITIGNFDGVHLGHQKLISSVVQQAKATNLTSVVITFDPHPEQFFASTSPPLLLMSLEDKIREIARLGVDILLILPFSTSLASMSPEEFISSILVEKLHVKKLTIGYDYAFGKGRKGTAKKLTELGEVYNFFVEQIAPLIMHGGVISSTRIRKEVISGNVKEASILLGRPYAMSGKIVHGENRGGKLLGFPTANVSLAANITAPKPGVYAVRCILDLQMHCCLQEADKTMARVNNTITTCHVEDPYCFIEKPSLLGVASIGYNPTFGDVPFGLEVYLLDFDKDIYDNYLHVGFIQRLRDEVKFSSIDALIAQITDDTTKAREILST